MFRKMEIYLRSDQTDFLRDMAYLESRKVGKRVGVAQLVRVAVDVMIHEKGKKVHKETQRILASPQLMRGIKQAHKDMAQGKYSYDMKKVFEF